MQRLPVIPVVLVFLLASTSTNPAFGALPREVRRALSQMSKEARSISVLVRKQKIDEAKSVIVKLDQRVTELSIEDGERDQAWKTFQKQMERARNAIPVSFESEVAPILSANCTRCHGENRAAANLRLDTFNGLRRGGRRGPLLKPRNPGNSLIMLKLTEDDDQQRMPRGANRLPDGELNTIGKWISDGAVFDGDNRDAPIGASTRVPLAEVNVVMADGSETVSFKNDVAPILVTFCLRCHRGNTPRGGFSVVTVTDVLRGGDTGQTIIPGDSDSSYLWKLVGLQDPIKMPQGQTLLKRSQAGAIKRWIDEGAHFDGDDVKAPLRSMVPSEATKATRELVAMNDEEFAQRRIEQAAALWRRAAPGEEADAVTADNFYVYGNVGSHRLKELAELAQVQVNRLQQSREIQEISWRGRLIIFACRDRFEYTEFNAVLRDQQTPRETHGHVVLTDQLETAYAVFHDRDQVNSARVLSSDHLLNSLVAQAWLARDGSTLPDWLQQGFGLAESGIDAQLFKRLSPQALRAVKKVESPATIFSNGVFARADVPIVGAMLIRFLRSQGKVKFNEFLETVRIGSNPAEAISSAYRRPAETIARAFVANLAR